VARRTIPKLTSRYRVYALIRNTSYADHLRQLGVVPMMGDLDDRTSLSRIAGLADAVLHFAPPANPPSSPFAKGGIKGGLLDVRTQHLLSALSQATLPERLVYISTSGVYGDCGGERVDETRAVNPASSRGKLRVDAERQIRAWAKRNGVNASILRVPGIYAEDRLPLARLQAGSPAMVASEDSYSNHIHADDLANIAVAALQRGKSGRIYHATDDDEMKMGDYFDMVARAYGLPRSPRMTRDCVQRAVSPVMWSFMNESRRLGNKRMKCELKVKLTYPKIDNFLFKII